MGKKTVGAINAGMWRSRISSPPSSLSGPGAEGDGGDAGGGWTVLSGDEIVKAISVFAGGWMWADDEETVESSNEAISSSRKNGLTSCVFTVGWTGSTGSMMGEGEGSGDGGSGTSSGSGSSETVSGHLSSSLLVSFNGLIGTESNGCTTAGETGVATSMIGEWIHPPSSTLTSK